MDGLNAFTAEVLLLNTVLADSIDEADGFKSTSVAHLLRLHLHQGLDLRCLGGRATPLKLQTLPVVGDQLKHDRDQAADDFELERGFDLAQVELDQALEEVGEASELNKLLLPDVLNFVG